MKSFVLFNNKGGVGKTTLTFNIAHMMAREGWRVAVLDYDPQCNLSALFLDDEQLMECWQADSREGATVAACLEPVRRGKGDVSTPKLLEIDGAPGLWLLPGHLSPRRSSMSRDPYCLSRIKHFASLVPFAQQARKPMFDLRRADGISGGGQSQAVALCRKAFEELVEKIAQRAGIPRP